MIIRNATIEDCDNLSALAIYVWLDTYAMDGLRSKISQFVFHEFSSHNYREMIDSPHKQIQVGIKEDMLIGFVVLDYDSKFNDMDDPKHTWFATQDSASTQAPKLRLAT